MIWRPIETAPKDGSYVLVYEDGWEPEHGNVDIAKWWIDEQRFVTDEGLSINPTHWMPLPEPPNG